MGYYIKQRDVEFTIKAENKEKALKAIKKLTNTKSGNDSFAWVNMKKARETDNLNEALIAWRWIAYEDNNGNIDCLAFDGEKWGSCSLMFSAIAPYVKKGSYIEMSGEEGEIWRWQFDGKKMIEKFAEITF